MIFGSEYLLTLLLLNTCLTYAVYPMAMIGRTSLAPIAHMAIGAYAASYAVERGWSIWLGALIGLGLNLVLATAFSGVLSRLRGHFYVAASLGLVFIVNQLAFVLDDITNGYLGVSQPADLINPDLAWVLLGVCVAAAVSIEFSFQNTVWRSVGENDVIASALGVSVRRQVLIASWAGAVIATGVGVIYSNAIAFFDPSAFGFALVLYLIIAVVAGGSSSWYGPILGGLIMTLLPELLRETGAFREAILGVTLALCVMFLPRGLSDRVTLMKWVRRLFGRLRGVAVNGDDPSGLQRDESSDLDDTDPSAGASRATTMTDAPTGADQHA